MLLLLAQKYHNGAFFFILVVWGFELRASYFLGMSSTTLATLPALFYVGYFQDRVSQNYLPRLTLNCDPTNLCLLTTSD
jgi:hypothetical protein